MCARWQLPCTVDRPGHRRRPAALPLRRRGGRGHAGRGARRRAALSAPRRAARGPGRARARGRARCRRSPIPARCCWRLLAAPNICAKTWVYEQYDQVVGSGTVARPGGDAGVVRLTPSERGIAVALDGDGARVALDPRRGGAEAVAQAALNVACSGAEPAAITNCLNFGNPERPGTAYALREAITGMAEACEVLGTPVVSGNVSLYNESGGRPIHPTPVVGCVGRAGAGRRGRARRRRPTRAARCSRSARPTPAYDGSEWQALVAGAAAGRIPEVDLPALRWLCDLLGELARDARARARPTTSPTAASRSRWPRSRSPRAAGSRPTIEPGDDARGDALRRVLRPRRRELRARRRGAPGRGLRRCRGAARENRRPGRRADRAALRRARARRRRWTTRARPTRAPCRERWRPADVRRLRHPRARPRRRAPRLLRALRAPAPRAGERGHRRQRRPPRAHRARHGARRAGLRRGQAAGAARAARRSGTPATRRPARRTG